MTSSSPRILVYLLRRDLRLSDSPVFHYLSTAKHNYTHVLPVYACPPIQMETSGLLATGSNNPYPEARSRVGQFWRMGIYRAKFLSEALWDLKTNLETVKSGLVIRVGPLDHVLKSLVAGNKDIRGVFITRGVGTEENAEERAVKSVAAKHDLEFRLFKDESYLIHDDDLPCPPKQVSDVFTSFRKTVEPLRDNVRDVLPKPQKLPPLPDNIPAQDAPFEIPSSREEFEAKLCKPLKAKPDVTPFPTMPENAKSCHPLDGGETQAQKRLSHYVNSGAASTYKDTRNGLVGTDASTKFSAYLSLGCITARQIHKGLYDLEEERNGGREDKGTNWIRFELLWRDYMRQCALKFGSALFAPGGFARDDNAEKGWRMDKRAFKRWQQGTTGTGLIDASQRELALTGYTSNRARQNVASFLTKHLHIDWRLGAEWYESLLIDYDVASNWGNWQYTAGVGNDPRGSDRVFNPVKQASDYDPGADYVRMWVPELANVSQPTGAWQAWTLSNEEKQKLKLEGIEWVERPLKRINWSSGRGGRGGGSGGGRGRGRGRGGRR